jgi:hypothetical protein
MIPQGENVLLLDSDIFIPDSFEKYIHYELQYDVLYGCDRYDYYSYSNFINDNYDNKYSLNFMGFFQLFKNNKRYAYEDSENCRQCDWDFCYKFPERILLEGIALKHLGRDNVNHFGRKNLDDFMMS